MKTEHKYAQVLRWIADGSRVECREHPNHEWADWPKDFCSTQIENVVSGIGDFGFRLKPHTITVNGREIVAGESAPVAHGAGYFLPCLVDVELNAPSTWTNHAEDRRLLERGLVHLTKENAIAHAKAMLGVD